MKSEELTYQTVLDFCTVQPGQHIRITEKSSFNRELYLCLSTPSASEIDWRLRACFMRAKHHYLILAKPRAFDDDQPETVLTVLRLHDKDTLIAIDEQEFADIASEAARAKDSNQMSEPDVVEILGKFPEAEF